MDSDMPKIIEQFLKQHFHNNKFKEKYQEEKAEFIKGLEAEIGDELRTRINKIKGRLILLVGKSVKASEAAGRYAYCIKGHTILNFYSCSGKTDERIENILNDSEHDDGRDAPKYGKIEDCLSSGGAVFLGDLECYDRPLLKRLADGIRNVKNENYDKGMLIVSTTTDRDSVPEYFKELFEGEVIYLEPEKKDISTSVPQDTPEKQDVPPVQSGGWSVSDKQEVCLNGKTVTKLPGIPYKLFRCLLKKSGKFVNTKTLEKCWDRKPEYDKFLVDTMNELEATLKKELTKKGINIQGEIIESQKNDKRRIIAYKLPR